MSSGLTYVTIYDYDTTASPNTTGTMQLFASYQEALDFALYQARFVAVILTASSGTAFLIQTFSPNQNGYVLANTSSPVFVPLD
jgi:hypothetical protein